MVASLTLDTGLLVLDMGPHNCDIARSNVKLTDVEMNRGRSLFSEQKIEAYRGVGGVSHDDGVEPAPAAAPGEARQTPPAGLCDQPPTPDGVYFYFQLPGNHLEWPEVRFPANSIPAVAKEAVAFMRELETKYHP